MSSPSPTLPKNAAEVMSIFGFASDGADACDDLWWRTDGGRIRLFVRCNDTFEWGTADCEAIEDGDEELLRRCLEDLRPYGEEYYLAELFAARKRHERPMRLWLGIHPTATEKQQHRKPKSLQLFLDCGPERDPKSEG